MIQTIQLQEKFNSFSLPNLSPKSLSQIPLMDPSTPIKTHQSKLSKTPKKDENKDPNLIKLSKSPIIIKSVNKSKNTSKPTSKNPSFSSPKTRIRERKFVVAKRDPKREKQGSGKRVCSCEESVGKKCLCLAYESLRASQEDFFKKKVDENGVFGAEEKVSEFGQMGCLDRKKRVDKKEFSNKRVEEKRVENDVFRVKEKVLEFGQMGCLDTKKRVKKKDVFETNVAKEKVSESVGNLDNKKRVEEKGVENGVLGVKEKVSEFGQMGCLDNKKRVEEKGAENDVFGAKEKVLGFEGCSDNKTEIGKVMSLVNAFEKLKTGEIEFSNKGDDNIKEAESEFCNKGPESQVSLSSICPSDFLGRASLDSSQGSFSFSSKGCVDRRSRRNSAESSGTFGGRRWRKKQQQLKATRQQPFKLLTEQRGKNKEEDFTKKLQDMIIEEQKQRIPIAQGLPWTTDEPENLMKPPVKDNTRPVDLVLHSDVRAMDRAEFDQQLAEKEALIEQFKMEREKQIKMAEEEEIKRLRKELIPKAQPMPYFDRPFIPKRKHHFEKRD